MKKDRPMSTGISNEQRLELQCTYLKALERAIPSMTSAMAQAQIANSKALTRAINEINLPLILSSNLVTVDLQDPFRLKIRSVLDLSSISSTVEWYKECEPQRLSFRHIYSLMLTKIGTVPEVVNQLRCIDLNCGTFSDFVHLVNYVLRIGDMSHNEIIVINPNWMLTDMYYGIRLKAGCLIPKHYTWTKDQLICDDIRKTIVVGVRDMI